ncbi:MAG TPA: C25 family cysteine peptidase [Anaerolineae bacterium]|nr:C25 family cysteine peptidase [Anaerolineae bacterium]
MATHNNRWRPARLAAWLALLLISALLLAACGRKDAGGTAEPTATAQPRPATAAEAVPASPPRPVDVLKLLVDQPGLYRVTASDLRAAGLDPTRHDPAQLALTLAGQPVTLAAEGSGDALQWIFYGEPRDSRYGQENAYRLSWGDQAQDSAVRAVAPAAGQPVTTFTAQQRLEEQQLYLSQLPAGSDHWLWHSLFAPDTFSVPFDLPGWAGGDVDLTVSLWANTEDAAANPDHRALLEVNGQQVAESAWDGKGWRTITATLPADSVQPADNTLALVAPGDTGATVDVIYLDRIDLAYDRTVEVDGGQLVFTAEAGAPLAVQGVDTAQARLWDVTDPSVAQPVSGAEAGPAGLSFQDNEAEGLRRYVVAEPATLLTPLAIQPADGIDLRQNAQGADYIAIAHPDFIDALQPLIDFRRAQGLRVAVASIEDVYDTFSGGMIDPAAIRDYMLYARDNWPGPAPRYLLLVGDASYDYQGFLPGSTPNFVPTYLLQTHFVGETASDNWFVSLDDEDDRPDMAVGRIPAQTAEQVADVVAKTLAYEQDPAAAEWSGRALFVADDKQSSFQEISDNLATNFLPETYEVEKVYLGQTDDPNAEVIQQLNQGVGLLTYVGHGSMNVWAQEKILRTEDATVLSNDALPFMMTMTCLVGYFHHPQAISMGEELLFNPNGGVVAALVPTSESLASDQSELASNIYTHLFGDAPTVGEAIMLGKRDLSAERDLMQDLIETFTLLGDPALRLQRPN